jgi:hypothetical protein
MIIIIEEQDIERFVDNINSYQTTTKQFGIPSRFIYEASIVAKCVKGDIEIIKSRHCNITTREIVERFATFFDRKKKIQKILE